MRIKKTRLLCLDMDNSLIDSDKPEFGIEAWEQYYNKTYPHKGGGWWSKPESLDLDVFDIQPFPDIHQILKDAPANTITVLLTNRMVELEKEVKAVLDKHQMVFDHVSLKKGWKTTKGQRIEKYLRENLDIIEVDFYDDDPTHFDDSQYLIKKFPDVDFKFYLVVDGKPTSIK